MLQEVVTTATRYDREIIETPRSVTVINSDVFKSQTFNSVGELLSNYAGIYVTGANQTPGSTQTLFMRGAAGNQVAIMIDGVRINDPSSPNSALDLSELSLTNVDRVEIIRGSHSTLYGGAAVGGVVNIITKKRADHGLHGDVTAGVGTFGKSTFSTVESIGLNYTLKNGMYLNGSLFNQNVNGLNASLDTSKHTVFPGMDRDDFEKTDALVKAGFKNSSWDAFVSYKRTDQHSEIDDGSYNDDDNAFVDFKRNFVNYQAGYQLSKNWRVSAIGAWSNSKRLIVNDSSVIDASGVYDATFSDAIYRGKVITNEIQINYQKENLTGVVGAGRYDEDMNFSTYYFNRSPFGEFISVVNYDTIDTSSSTTYAFGQINLNFGNFDFAAGTRWSRHSIFGHFWTFEANPSFYVNNTLLYASFSTGFNPPSLYQLYDPSKPFNAYTTRGNMALDPEASTSFEVGIKKEFDGGSYLTLSAYRTETDDAIEYAYLWNKETPVEDLTFADNMGDTYLNIANQVVSGLEVEGSVGIGKFKLRGNVSLIDGYITVEPSNIDVGVTGGNHVQLFNYGVFVIDEVDVNKLVRRPQLTAYAQFEFQARKNITTAIAYRHAGPRFDSGYDETLGPYGALNQFKVRSYNLIDLSINWSLSSKWLVSARVENVFDESYQEIIGFQTRGRSAYLKVNFSL
jgi:vitamin B12 transporter